MRPADHLASTGQTPAALAQARAVYDAAIVIDGHNDMPSKMLDDAYDPDVRHPAGTAAGEGHTDLPRLLESGITAQWMVAWVDATYAATPGASFARATEALRATRAWVGRHPGSLILATTASDVRRAKAAGRVAIFLAVEGGHALEDSLDNLRALHALGVRYLTLTWNNGNDWAGSSIGDGGTRTGGLTAFGRQVVEELQRLGMMVDVSHASSATLRDVLAIARRPILASHSSARALADHPRNLTDDELRAIAAAGGIINVNFYSRFIDPSYLAAAAGVDAELDRLRLRLSAPPPTLDAAAVDAAVKAERTRLRAALAPTPLAVLLDHFDHIIGVAGIDHVGLGSDFDGISAVPVGLADVTAMPRLAEGLLDRGHSPSALTQILGGNMLRVMGEAMG